MKNFFICLIGLIILLSGSMVSLAGSVPEDLLNSEDAQVYFGEVKSIDGERITVIQRQNIKGPFAQDGEVTYKRFSCSVTPNPGSQYLFGFYDDNNPLYIWEVTSFDTKTLEIAEADDPISMWHRMQEYINNGDFEKAEEKRLADIKAAAPAVESTEAAGPEPEAPVVTTAKEAAAPVPAAAPAPAAAEQSPVPAPAETGNQIPAFVWGTCGGLAAGAAIAVWRKKR